MDGDLRPFISPREPQIVGSDDDPACLRG